MGVARMIAVGLFYLTAVVGSVWLMSSVLDGVWQMMRGNTQETRKRFDDFSHACCLVSCWLMFATLVMALIVVSLEAIW